MVEGEGVDGGGGGCRWWRGRREYIYFRSADMPDAVLHWSLRLATI